MEASERLGEPRDRLGATHRREGGDGGRQEVGPLPEAVKRLELFALGGTIFDRVDVDVLPRLVDQFFRLLSLFWGVQKQQDEGGTGVPVGA